MDIRDVTVAHLSRRGMEEYGLRPLSHGRFTGTILTRNVAETVLLSQIQKRLREENIDVDATIEAIYKSKNLKHSSQELRQELRARQPGRAAHAGARRGSRQVQAAAQISRSGRDTY